MSIKGDWISYGDQIGYLAVPERARKPLPSVVVIQEIFGVNDHIEDVTRRIAAAGYAALAPDLLAVGGVRPPILTRERISEMGAFMAKLPPAARTDRTVRDAELAKLPKSDADRILETMQAVWGTVASPDHMAGYMEKLRAAVRHLRYERPETSGQKTACVGFCMGGSLSALLACEEPELSGAAVFYGTTPPEEKMAQIRCPVIAFYGEDDQRVNAGIPAFVKGMKDGGKSFDHVVYHGAGHSFFNDDSGAYNVEAARDAFSRLLSFFVKVLT